MSPYTFLRSLLLVPLVVPLVAWSLGQSLEYAGVPINGAIVGL